MIAPLDESLEGKILTVPQKDEGPQYTKKGTLRKRKPKTKNQYFTADTEEAIIEYVNETDQDKRNAIYNARIKYGFFKLTENINPVVNCSNNSNNMTKGFSFEERNRLTKKNNKF